MLAKASSLKMPKRSRFEPIPPYKFCFDDPKRSFRRCWRMVYVARYHRNATAEEVNLLVLRSFGLYNSHDRQTFADLTGRLKYLQTSFRAALIRRRKQAYETLKRKLPTELASAIAGPRYIAATS